MLIDFKVLDKYKIQPFGVIHVGMHEAEEHPIYMENGVERVLYIEANPVLAHKVNFDEDNVWVVNAAVSDVEEEVDFQITNNGQSSSILKLKDHSDIYPHIRVSLSQKMKTVTLDKILSHEKLKSNYFNIINLDIQGAELKAMKGLTDWEDIQAVFTEVNYREMYEGCALIGEIDEFLAEKGFKKVEEVDTGAGWGDALYVR